MIAIGKLQEIKRITFPLIDKPLQDIATANGIKVFNVDLNGILSSGEVSGFIIYNENTGYSIYINSTEAESRQRFTLAHELGHFFLHKDLIEKDKVIVDLKEAILFRRSDNANEIIEQEANAFAAELLMPEEIVKKAWETTDNPTELARVFDVSFDAMSYRLRNLGILAKEGLD